MTPSTTSGPQPAKKTIKRMLRDCEARIAELDVPVPCDIARLAEYLSRRRNRLIHLMPIAMRASQPSGIWLALKAVDVVLYEAETSKTHQEHIIAHELAHIICDHHVDESLDTVSAHLIFPGLDPALVRDMLNRAEYSDSHELEAEIMASVILRRINCPSSDVGATGSPETAEVLERLERSFSINAGLGT